MGALTSLWLFIGSEAREDRKISSILLSRWKFICQLLSPAPCQDWLSQVPRMKMSFPQLSISSYRHFPGKNLYSESFKTDFL